MKGINLKKIGAIVAGATILASSVAFAGLMYENTELVDANGQPVAKVVLGSGAAASDGAVAGAIAAKLASAAYKKTTLTAAVAADATGTCGATGNGTCAVSNERVTLEVTVPGATSAGVHEFATLIADYVDKELQNRDNQGSEDLYDLGESESDVMEANPFDVEGGSTALLTDEDMYRIASDNFGPFASKTITDTDSGDTYTEYQFAWIKGSTEFSSSDNAIEANLALFAYQVKFDESTHTGIPQCTEDDNSDKDWADCLTTDAEYTGKHRVKIDFLGTEWIITDLAAPAEVAVDDEEVEVGGSVTLAKESVYGIINVGDTMTSKDGQLKVRLDDISTLEDEKPAIVSFIDANGNVISQDQIAAGSTVKKTIGGNVYKVRVYQTAPGYTFGAKWVEMALIENELELKDGDTLEDDNEDWNVNVLWKNKEGSVAADDVDTLRGILLYRSAFGDALMAGDSVNMIEDPVAYKLTYLGLDLTSSDYDTLKYATGGSVTLSMDYGTGYATCQLDANEYIKVTSTTDEAFRYAGDVDENGDSVTGKGKEVYYLTVAPDAGDCDTDLGADATTGDIVMKESSGGKYVVIDTDGESPDVEYKTAGSGGDTTDGGVLEMYNGASPSFLVYEDIGTATSASDPTDEDDHTIGVMAVYYDAADETFYSWWNVVDDKVSFWIESDTAANDVDLSGLGYMDELNNPSEYDEGEFISPRGSKFESMTSSTVQFKVAKKLGKAQYEFATSEAAAAGSETTTLILSEGQSGTVGDVTIKAKSIDETVGACAATGGSATCTVPKDQISAVIMPNNAASVDAVIPYAVNPKLVVLDRDAAATTTGVLITVGGDQVNSVTADAMAGAGIDFTATPVVVKQVGNKIIVAGLTADDTITAGDQFLAAVQAA